MATIIKMPFATINDATNYVDQNLPTADLIDEAKTFGSSEVNKVWWGVENGALGRNKIAHYNTKQQMLYIYNHQEVNV